MPIPYVGDSTATQAPSSEPGELDGITVLLPEDLVDDIDMASIAQEVKALADKCAWYDKYFLQDFGDGSDGNVTVSGAVILTRNMYYDTLTVNTGAQLRTNGWRIYCKTELIWNDGNISSNGGDASGATRGESANAGPHKMGYGGTGGNTTPSNGRNPQIVSADFSTKTGASGGTGDGGATFSGTARVAYADAKGFKIHPFWLAGSVVLHSALVDTTENSLLGAPYYAGAPGGAGGGGSSGGAGGGGGEGGGHIFLIARKITYVNGTCTANGGFGGNAAGDGGGGGSGAGGEAFAIYSLIDGTLPSVTANGGTPGSGSGTGTNGDTGPNGSGVFHTHQVGA